MNHLIVVKGKGFTAIPLILLLNYQLDFKKNATGQFSWRVVKRQQQLPEYS